MVLGFLLYGCFRAWSSDFQGLGFRIRSDGIPRSLMPIYVMLDGLKRRVLVFFFFLGGGGVGGLEVLASEVGISNNVRSID